MREVVSISLDEETLAAFDVLVRSRGSKRSLELRRLIQAELAGNGIALAPRTNDKGWRRFNVSLTPAEYQAVAVVAQSWAMKPSQWTAHSSGVGCWLTHARRELKWVNWQRSSNKSVVSV